MEYIKIRFGKDWGQRESGFERTLDTIFRSVNPMFADCDQPWNPQMDVYETHEEFYITAEIAGVNKEDLGVEINNKAVKISGRRSPQPRAADASFRLAEIQYGNFERVLYLPTAHRSRSRVRNLYQRISPTSPGQSTVHKTPSNSHRRRITIASMSTEYVTVQSIDPTGR